MLASLIREPLLHFLLIGTAVFGLYGALGSAPPPDPAEAEIRLDAAAEARLGTAFEAAWRRPPSAAEQERLAQEWLREEVLVREALKLGLDRDDPVIRQRLRQKMEFLIAAQAQAETADDATLQSHLAAHPERFHRPAMVAFEQVYLGEDEAAADAVRQALNAGADPATAGVAIGLPPALPLSPQAAVDGTFGPGVFAAVLGSPLGIWSGPVRSGYGLHLVRATAIRPETLPELSAIRDEVLRDWRAGRAEALTEARIADLMAGYRIRRAVDPADAGGSE